jgi:hypothetical protein
VSDVGCRKLSTGLESWEEKARQKERTAQGCRKARLDAIYTRLSLHRQDTSIVDEHVHLVRKKCGLGVVV